MSLLSQDDPLYDTWGYLQPRITVLLDNIESGLSNADYIGIYTAIYNYCQKRHTVSFDQFTTVDFTGADLYHKLRNFFREHLNECFKDAGSMDEFNLLSFYVSNWKNYITASKYIHNMCQYLNRHWIKRQNLDEKSDVHEVFTLALDAWKEIVFKKYKDNILGAVFNIIRKQRDGVTIDSNGIKSIVDSLVSLGFDKSDNDRFTLDCYREHFEIPFLKMTKEFYVAESKRFVAEHSIPDYIKQIDSRIKEEEARVEMYLHVSSLGPVREVCEEALIHDYVPVFVAEFRGFLDNDKKDDIKRLNYILLRHEEGLNKLRSTLEEYIKLAGLAEVKKVVNEKNEALEPKDYVDTILAVNKRFTDLVSDAFNNEPGFVASLDKGCREFINRNELSNLHNSTTKTPEMVARYCDALLKKGSKLAEDIGIDALLSDIMVIFRYIEDKDVFQKFYSQSLAKRLVNGTSIDDDSESSMISKLKDACGFEYTSKLSKMFHDMSVSRELNQVFQDKMSINADPNDPRMDINILVLGSSSWPFKPPSTDFKLPAELARPYDKFKAHYLNKHNSRCLNVLWQHCKGEIRTPPTKHAKSGYVFQASTYQIAILVMFNDNDSYTYEQILEETKLSDEALVGPLSILVKAKLLLVKDNLGVGTPNSTYIYNKDFRSKKLRMNLNVPIKSDVKTEADETHKNIAEDRKLYIQAALVRIMKARKSMKYTTLINETIAQLQTRFSPDVSDIKKCIDILLEREYLARDEEDRETLIYLA